MTASDRMSASRLARGMWASFIQSGEWATLDGRR
jgi:hypothetical protein